MTLIKDIQEIIKINTEYDETSITKEAPFGKNVAKGLTYMEEKARQEGFIVKNVDNRALAISLGESSERVEAVCHIDVVEASGMWSYPPYEACLVDNKIYGRGTQDMKTQIMIIMHALKKIRKENIPLKRQIRLVVGTDEERTMQDLVFYLEKEGLPEFAFTPDSSFPICLGEKGALNYIFREPVKSKILEIKAGTASNVICPELTFKTYDEAIAVAFEKDHECHKAEDGLYTIKVIGKGAHTSTPAQGINAITLMLNTLVDVIDEPWVQVLHKTFEDSYGKGMGLLPNYEPMGFASVCLNVLSIEDGYLSGNIDIRYPNPLTKFEIQDGLTKAMVGFKLIEDFYEGPIETKLDNPYVQTLLGVYRTYFPGDKTEPFYSGGITYSKVYQNRCVAYGPDLPFSDQVSLAHQIDEYVLTDYLDTLVDLYKDALVNMANL